MSRALTTEQENRLTFQILNILSQIELSLKPGDSVLVQPQVEGMAPNTGIAIAGFDWDQINRHLREMVAYGLISSGTFTRGPLVGIFFNHITLAGRRLLDR